MIIGGSNMRRLRLILKNEKGSIIVLGIAFMAAATLLGVVATTTSTSDNKITANDRHGKIAFSNADGGTELGQEMLEKNIAASAGFEAPEDENYVLGDVEVSKDSLVFWTQDDDEENPHQAFPCDISRDMHMPVDYKPGEPHTNISIRRYSIQHVTGAAIQMAAGYEGRGKSAAGMGTKIYFDIFSQHIGIEESDAMVRLQWRHVIGQEAL